MHAILVCIGSRGDTLPFVVIGRALRERGHRVTLIGNAQFIDDFRSEDIEYVESLTREQYQNFLRGQVEWSNRRTLIEMAQLIEAQVPLVYEQILERYVPGETVVVAQGYSMGARVAQEKLGVPLATVHLQPVWFRSTYDPVGVPKWVPRGVIRAFDRLIDWIIDITISKSINQFRGQLGLPPVNLLMKRWWNSPQLVLGLFPEWFNPPQPDYPPQTRLPGFPISLSNGYVELSPELKTFLDAGEPPILFTQSAVTKIARRYFEVSVAVAGELGRRAILLSPNPDQLPERLPPNIVAFNFLPLAAVLPRCCFHVHHGGIGTIAHTLAAGIPQLTVPMVYDQPENSERLLRLKISAMLKPAQYTVPRATKIIRELLDSPEVIQKCLMYAEKYVETDAIETCCELIEELHARHGAPHGPPADRISAPRSAAQPCFAVIGQPHSTHHHAGGDRR